MVGFLYPSFLFSMDVSYFCVLFCLETRIYIPAKINCLLWVPGSENLANIFSAEIYVASLRASITPAPNWPEISPPREVLLHTPVLSMFIERFGQTIKNIVPLSLSQGLCGGHFLLLSWQPTTKRIFNVLPLVLTHFSYKQTLGISKFNVRPGRTMRRMRNFLLLFTTLCVF